MYTSSGIGPFFLHSSLGHLGTLAWPLLFLLMVALFSCALVTARQKV